MTVNVIFICCQHFAHGDAWRLPAGAYETFHELKDAGGSMIYTSFPSIFFFFFLNLF